MNKFFKVHLNWRINVLVVLAMIITILVASDCDNIFLMLLTKIAGFLLGYLTFCETYQQTLLRCCMKIRTTLILCQQDKHTRCSDERMWNAGVEQERYSHTCALERWNMKQPNYGCSSEQNRTIYKINKIILTINYETN